MLFPSVWSLDSLDSVVDDGDPLLLLLTSDVICVVLFTVDLLMFVLSVVFYSHSDGDDVVVDVVVQWAFSVIHSHSCYLLLLRLLMCSIHSIRVVVQFVHLC